MTGDPKPSMTYAIADLHGRYDLLVRALELISDHAAERDYKVITLGDYIDRGPQSKEIIQHLIDAQDAGRPLICLKGNHEAMMVETLTAPLHPHWWIGNGGGQTLVSYGHYREGIYQPSVVPEHHVKWLDALPLMHVDEHRIFVHAGVEPELSLDEQDPEQLVWKRYHDVDERGHGTRHVVHGHEQFEDGPLLKAGRTDLDTFAWYTGRLAVGVFDDAKAGGPIEILEVIGEPFERQIPFRGAPNEDSPQVQEVIVP